jgi:hypothetical protein
MRRISMIALAVMLPGMALAQKADVRWQRFVDPVEHAFSLYVPQGWAVTGGTRRLSPSDVRFGVNVTSPDKAITVFYGDPDVPAFAEPSQVLAYAGFGVGSWKPVAPGTNVLVEPYASGAEFAADWGTGRMMRTCDGAPSVAPTARPDLSRQIATAYPDYNVTTTVDAGEAAFACRFGGTAMAGYVFAATERVHTTSGMYWDVKALMGFTAPQAAEPVAYGVLALMTKSFTVDPQWLTNNTNNANQFAGEMNQSNTASAQAAMAANAQLAAADAAGIAASEHDADTTYNAIESFDYYGVRGTSDFADSDTGAVFSGLDNSYAHTYVNDDGTILQTDSENSPGNGWHEVHALPPGQ